MNSQSIERLNNMDIKEKSYESLRNELIRWQERRYLIFSTSIVFVTALIGWFVTGEKNLEFTIAAILPHILILGASLLTRNTSLYSTKIGTYISVFYEDIWEINQAPFSKKTWIWSTNLIFALFYLGISIISTIILYKISDSTVDVEQAVFWILILISGLNLWSIIYLAFRSYPREKYLKLWTEIKNASA